MQTGFRERKGRFAEERDAALEKLETLQREIREPRLPSSRSTRLQDTLGQKRLLPQPRSPPGKGGRHPGRGKKN